MTSPELAKCGPFIIPLTPRQRQVVEFVHDYIVRHRVSPTRNEVAVHLGMSYPALANDHIQTLIRRGILEHTPRAARSLRLSVLGKDALGLTPDPSERALARARALLRSAAALLEQTMPTAPLLAEIQKEIA